LKQGFIYKLALVTMLGAAACGGDDEGDEPEQRANNRPAARRDSVVRQPVYPEAEAAQIFRVLNAHEIASARVARERSQNDDILRFASVMLADHRAMTALIDSLLPPIPDTINAESRALAEASAAVVDTLWKIEGGFNNSYMEQQVRDHERALILLDTALIPSARNPQLKKLLQDLRPAVLAHLQRARQIYSARMANPELRAATRTVRSGQPRQSQPSGPPLLGEPAPAPSAPTSTSNM
jgi:putative membrane protein